MTYHIAEMMESGEFDVIDTFAADDDAEAERYAETNCPDTEWYVLNDRMENINA